MDCNKEGYCTVHFSIFPAETESTQHILCRSFARGMDSVFGLWEGVVKQLILKLDLGRNCVSAVSSVSILCAGVVLPEF